MTHGAYMHSISAVTQEGPGCRPGTAASRGLPSSSERASPPLLGERISGTWFLFHWGREAHVAASGWVRTEAAVLAGFLCSEIPPVPAAGFLAGPGVGAALLRWRPAQLVRERKKLSLDRHMPPGSL